ncbi:hypothetical protein [Streptomyces sp. NPDC008141]
MVIIVLALTATGTAVADPALGGVLAALVQAGAAFWTALRSPTVSAPAHC